MKSKKKSDYSFLSKKVITVFGLPEGETNIKMGRERNFQM
jgi:hypothetical protein